MRQFDYQEPLKMTFARLKVEKESYTLDPVKNWILRLVVQKSYTKHASQIIFTLSHLDLEIIHLTYLDRVKSCFYLI